MKPHPLTGLVEVLDLAKTPPEIIKMWPVDVKEVFAKRIELKTGGPRYVLAENYDPNADTTATTSPAKAPA